MPRKKKSHKLLPLPLMHYIIGTGSIHFFHSSLIFVNISSLLFPFILFLDISVFPPFPFLFHCYLFNKGVQTEKKNHKLFPLPLMHYIIGTVAIHFFHSSFIFLNLLSLPFPYGHIILFPLSLPTSSIRVSREKKNHKLLPLPFSLTYYIIGTA